MPIELETERLIMRQMREEDAGGMFELNNDPEVIWYTGDSAFTDIEQTKAFIKAYDQYEKYRMGRLNCFLKSSGEYIGWCGLKRLPSGKVDLGYRWHKRYWGKGYATEAAKASLDYGFNTLHLDEIIATAMKPNAASINVMKKLGMTYSHDENCACEPGVVYVITKDQWK